MLGFAVCLRVYVASVKFISRFMSKILTNFLLFLVFHTFLFSAGICRALSSRDAGTVEDCDLLSAVPA